MIGTMMKINFKDIYENMKFQPFNTQKKLDVDTILSVYYGKTIDNKLRLSFLSKKMPPVIASTRLISIYQVSEENNIYWTCFDLLDIKAATIFYYICDDIVLSIVSEYNEDIALKKIKNRFDLWKKVLNKPINKEMTIEEAKGLFGELYFLNSYMFEKYGIEKAIKSWSGPDDYPKDFSIDNTWYEIKTTSINSNIIKISSLGQLDSEDDGNLVIIRLENMSEEYDDGLSSLGELLNDIYSKIDDLDLRGMLIEKLMRKGYLIHNSNTSYKFRFVNKTIYLVNDDFPRIKQSDIKYSEVEEVVYSLRISSLERFKKC
ncbi:MAG TPA: PD-(D/E)XK motif protein [Bacilli bacterium]|nr:PD-(D/E)XK motif protein [Bacilli bacterium]